MYLSDIATLHLAITGVLVSVVTLVFATIVSKREEYRSIRRSTDKNLQNRAVELSNDIGRLKNYCSQLLIVVAISFFMYILFTLANYFFNNSFLCIVTWIAGILTMAVLVWIIILSVRVVRFFINLDN